MAFLQLLLRLVPAARADELDQIGRDDPAIVEMWNIIKGIFPHTDGGAAFPVLILMKVIGFLLWMVGGTAVCIVIYAGIRLILTLGTEEEFQKTKSLILRALLGLFVILVSYVIVRFVIVAFSG